MTVITQPVTYFTIDGTPSDTPGWNVENIDVLLKPAGVRGAEGVAIVNAHGRLAQRMWRDHSTRLLTWTINGHADHEGTPYTDVHEGVEANLAYLVEHVVAVPGNADSTRTLILYTPSGGTRTGLVQVRGFDWESIGPHLRAVMELYIPAGELETTGS